MTARNIPNSRACLIPDTSRFAVDIVIWGLPSAVTSNFGNGGLPLHGLEVANGVGNNVWWQESLLKPNRIRAHAQIDK
jgi:hypothetical protein